MSEWKESTIGQLVQIKNGFAFKGEDFVDDGVPVIKIKNVKPNKILLDNLSYVSETVANGKDSYLIQPNDILITMSGNRSDGSPDSWVGKVALFKKTGRYLLNQRVSILRVDENKAIIPFIAYYLSSWENQVYLINQANSSGGQANIAPDTIKAMEIALPPLSEQKAIASVLSSLDDKIDLLHRQNATLEAMAKTLFRQWFVEEAKEEWEEYKVSDIADHLKTNIIPSKHSSTIFHHYSLPAFDEGKSPVSELGGGILSNKYQVFPNSILVSKLNPRFPRIWAIGESIPDNSICSTEFQVFKPKDNNLFAYLYFLFTSEEARNALTMAASGTSGSHQRVRPEDISNISFSLPDYKLAIELSKIAQPFLNKTTQNQRQIRTLTSLRDTLLPKLMSGEIKVKV